MEEKRKPIEGWAEEFPHPHVSSEMARIEMGWPLGVEITQLQWYEVCHRVATTPIGYQVLGMRRRA